MNPTTTYLSTLSAIADAYYAIAPYWRTGAEAPAEVADTLAESIIAASPEHIARADQENPKLELGKLRTWAERQLERRAYPRFFELMEVQATMTEAEFERMEPQERMARLVELLGCAPPRFFKVAEAVLQAELPHTHVNDDGRPIYTMEEIASHFAKTPEQVASDIEYMRDAGLVSDDALYASDTHRLQ